MAQTVKSGGFLQNRTNQLTIKHLANPLKIGVFSSKSFFVENFQNMEAKNGHFVNIVQKKSYVNRSYKMGFH